MSDQEWRDLFIEEIRENRKEIKSLQKTMDSKFTQVWSKITAMDKQIFGNKIKLAIFIACLTFAFSTVTSLGLWYAKEHLFKT